MDPAATWRPLVDGVDAERARDTVLAIADAIAVTRDDVGPGLFGGAAGLALLFAYLHEAFPQRGYGDECARWLARAAHGYEAALPLGMSGIAGVAWTIEHLIEGNDGDPNAAFDAALEDELADAWTGDYDLISGLVGLGCYALERGACPEARRCLVAVLDHLAMWSEQRGDGLVWWTPPRLLDAYERGITPTGKLNLGLAHGQPGVIALLARMTALPELAPRARPLLEGAVRGIAMYADAGFGYHVVSDETPEPARAAWCYGNPGVAIALLAAGEHDVAIGLALRAAALSPVEARVVDAGLCHGASGLLHIYNRMAHATGNAALREHARAWIHHTLAFARPGEGIAGYTSHRGSLGPKPVLGLLDGAAGIALALLAAVSDVPPAWDRSLMMS